MKWSLQSGVINATRYDDDLLFATQETSGISAEFINRKQASVSATCVDIGPADS